MLYLINLQTVSFQSCGPVPAKIALVALIKKDRGPEAQTRPADALRGLSPLLLPPVSFETGQYFNSWPTCNYAHFAGRVNCRSSGCNSAFKAFAAFLDRAMSSNSVGPRHSFEALLDLRQGAWVPKNDQYRVVSGESPQYLRPFLPVYRGSDSLCTPFHCPNH